MSDVAISVENLSKLYHIGQKQARYKTLRESLMSAASAPLRRLANRQVQKDPSAVIWALKDVSFQVKQGEVVGIIGRNGAGKSTLLKILCRITEPTEGRALMKGRVGSLLEVGTGFHPELTGRDNIYLNGAILGMKRVEIARKFDEIVTFAEIEKFLDTPVKHYSSGMYVRLAFAVAAHLEPEILLVDEVLAVGDAQFQKKCLGKMGEVAKEGRTVLFVSHNMAAVLNLCQWGIALRSGLVSKTGTAQEVVSHYLDDGVYLGGRAVIPVELGSTTGELCFSLVHVFNAANTPTEWIPLTEGLSLELEYDVNKPVRGANVAFHLWNSFGTCILTSTDVDINPAGIVDQRQAGRYVARCQIPPHFFRPGRYRIGVSASIPNVRVLADIPDVLVFEVVDTGSVESRLAQGREGVIAPILKWTTTSYSSDGG